MNPPTPAPIYRFLHIENLPTCLERAALYAPRHTPNDGRTYKTIHNADIQNQRRVTPIPCGPRGVVHDYVSFYFGPRSPMLYQLHTGWVQGYSEGQRPLVYLVSTAQIIDDSGAGFVFSDGHGNATYTEWFDDLRRLDHVDWEAVYARMWRDTVEDPDRQRRKQAEFLVHRRCDWDAITEIGVLDAGMRGVVEEVLRRFPERFARPVKVRPEWYY